MFNLWTAWNQFSKFKDYNWIVHNGGRELRDFHFEISVKIVIFDHCNSMYTQGKIFSFVVQSSCQASWKHFFFFLKHFQSICPLRIFMTIQKWYINVLHHVTFETNEILWFADKNILQKTLFSKLKSHYLTSTFVITPKTFYLFLKQFLLHNCCDVA